MEPIRRGIVSGCGVFVTRLFTSLLLVSSFALFQPDKGLAFCGSGSACSQADAPGYAGKPINLLTGEETLQRTDLTLGSIAFERRYSSKSKYDGVMGYGWMLNYDSALKVYTDGSIAIRRGDGQKSFFALSRVKVKDENQKDIFVIELVPSQDETGTIAQNADNTYTYTDKSGGKEHYGVTGSLLSMIDPRGSSVVFTYEPVPDAPQDSNAVRLKKVEEKNSSGSFTGRWATIAYGDKNRISGLNDSLGRSVAYIYDSVGNLISADSFAMASTYGYHDPNGRHRMTSINEGSGEYTNTYDDAGRVIKQTHGTGVIDVQYLVPARQTKVTTTIRDESGNVLNIRNRMVEFNVLGQTVKETDTFGNETRYERNAQNQVTKEEHWENSGTILKYSISNAYDAKGNLLTRTEGGEGVEKSTTYTYEPTFNKVKTETVKSVVDPGQNKVTTYGYDAKGNATTVTETGLLGDGTPYSYVTTFGYNSDRRITTIDGPRTDVQDVTEFTYDPANGNLTSMTQPLIGTTTYSDHDGFGNPEIITDPNGNATTYTYDVQGRVLTVKAPGDTAPTQYTYISEVCGSGCSGGTDKIASITFPEGNGINYAYDDYGNLKTITDTLGNSVNYAYDSEGNRRKEDIKDPSGVLQKTLAYQYDALNRLKKIINPDSNYTEYGYDSLGNRISLRNPNAAVTGYEYDGLSRLKTLTQPGDVKTLYGYDTNDDLTTVTDANSNATTYKYDDMGRVYQVISPDTGTTTYTYDPAGNMISKKDAKEVTINYTYDVLNRLTTIDFPTDTDIVYTYDTCLTGKGRLCGMTDASGTTSYEYFLKGQMKKETKVIDGVTYVTQYTYNQNGDVTSLTYPGGRVVNYNYVLGLASSVSTTAAATTDNLATDIKHQAFGGIKSFTYGNGLGRTLTYDSQGRIGTIVTGKIQSLTYTYDANSNITGLTNNVDLTRNKTYAYDELGRLTDATGPWGTLNYTYDGVGNRKTETTGTGTTNYTYTTNKLMSSTGEKALTFGYDSNGNTISENSRQYVYSQNQRLIKAAEGAGTLGEYVYNANGQRAKKVSGGNTTVFHFDNGGRLIAESDNSGNIDAQYVYLIGQPLAKIDSIGVNYIHTDHLGTPVMMTNAQGVRVWEIESKPFGDDANISGSITLDIRFPGQYYDAETGNHYNYFRDYNPQLGRYIEADPIEFNSGDINLYSYVGNHPLNYYDPLGLYVAADDAIFAIGGATVGLAGQGLGDLLSGELSGWEDYTGAAVGGASGGWVLLYTGPVGAGAAGGAITSATKQILRKLSGKLCKFNVKSFVFDTGIGALTGYVPGARIPGITAGRGSYSSIYRQMTTKFARGQISTVRVKTASKMLAGRAINTGLLPGTGAAAAAGAASAGLFVSEVECKCK